MWIVDSGFRRALCDMKSNPRDESPNKNPASLDEKWGLCFHFLILKTVFCFSGGDFTKFTAVNCLYTRCGNATIVEAFLAERVVKDR